MLPRVVAGIVFVDRSQQAGDGETGVVAWHTKAGVAPADAAGDPSVLVNRMAWRLWNALNNAEIARANAGRAIARQSSDLTARANAVWSDDLATMHEARKLFDEALRIEPNYVPALLGRAWT